MSNKKRALGRGIGNFVKDSPFVQDILEDKEISFQELPIDIIVANEEQPRAHFDTESLKELAESIKEVGILQPLLVRKQEEKYEVIAGERRLRAAKMVGLATVPVIIADLTQEEADRVALIENIQREDLNPIEESMAYARLQEEYGYTQQALADYLGKSRSYIANALRLRKLHPKIQDYISKGEINISQAKLLLSIKDEKEQLKRAHEIVEAGSTVRETHSKIKSKGKKKKKDPYIVELENNLMDRLGTKVNLKTTGKKKQLTIDYYSDEDLQRILDIIMGGESFE